MLWLGEAHSRPRCPLGSRLGHATADAGPEVSMIDLCSAFRRAALIIDPSPRKCKPRRVPWRIDIQYAIELAFQPLPISARPFGRSVSALRLPGWRSTSHCSYSVTRLPSQYQISMLMTEPLDLTDEERQALIALLRRTLDYTRYPRAPRFDPLKAILAKLDPRPPQPDPLPPLPAGAVPRVRRGRQRR
jgi:hypothetical protein